MHVAFGRVRRKTEPTGGRKCLFIFRFQYKKLPSGNFFRFFGNFLKLIEKFVPVWV